jgi:GNAT superfamily N-acetyltransferase
VARFVRSPDNPNEAEYAIAVADDWQGRGLGTALLHALEQRAREEGIEWFTGLVLADNRQMLDVLAGLGGFEQRRADYGTVEVRLHIPEASHEQEPERISGWMRAAASGDLTSRLGD